MFLGEFSLYKFGYCYAFAPLRCPTQSNAEPAKDKRLDQKSPPLQKVEPPNYDITLSDRCGALDVLVTRDGKPLADASVTIEPDNPAPLGFGVGDLSAWNSLADRILHPTAVTSDDGLARFNGLVPGTYSIYIFGLDGMGATVDQRRYELNAYGQATEPAYRGVIIAAKQTQKFHAVVYSRANPVDDPSARPRRKAGGQLGLVSDEVRRNRNDGRAIRRAGIAVSRLHLLRR